MEEQGCGVCVEDLTDNLDELLVQIQNSSDSLPTVNQTQEDLLQQEIMRSQVRRINLLLITFVIIVVVVV